jgi:hypothetical protein
MALKPGSKLVKTFLITLSVIKESKKGSDEFEIEEGRKLSSRT